jgi:putative transposase
MTDDAARYPRYRFPPEIISHAVWLYYCFILSFREVDDLLAQRGITVSYETIRHSGPRLRPREGESNG